MLRFVFLFVFSQAAALTTVAEALEPRAAVFLCYGITEGGNADSPRTGFTAVLRQTNKEVVDGRELLNEELYSQTFQRLPTFVFEARIFEDAKDYWVGETPQEIGEFLLSSTIPLESYSYQTEIGASVGFKSFDMTWNYDQAKGIYNNSVNYRPSSKSEIYRDSRKGIRIDVWCEEPFVE